MEVRVVGIGVSYLDHLFVLPSLDGLQQEACPVSEARTEGGGVTATAMVAVARLGGKAELWSRVGDDDTGNAILAGLRREGVDTSQVQTVRDAASSRSFIAVDGRTGERRIFYCRGDGLDRADAAKLDLHRIIGAGAMLVDHSWPEAALPALEMGREAGIPSCADLSRIDEGTMPFIERLDVLIVPEECARGFAGGDDYAAGAAAMQKLGPSTVVVTLGPAGCLVRDGDHVSHQGAFAVEAVDTTGAGDAFHGAYAYAMARRWTSQQSVVFASAVAALKCRRLGGRAGLPTLEETVEFLRAKRVPCKWCE